MENPTFWDKFTSFWENYGELIVILFCVVFSCILIVVAIREKKKNRLSTKILTDGAIAIALSMVLNLVTLFSMPNGGSVTLARILPLLIFAYIYGIPKGLLIGALYGVLDFIAKPYFLNIFQFLLDYPLAFACCGFAGILRNNEKLKGWSMTIGTVVVGIGRFIFSTISGTLYWGLPFVPSMAYNSVLLIDTAVCLVIIIIVSRSKAFMNILDSRKPKKLATNVDNVVDNSIVK